MARPTSTAQINLGARRLPKVPGQKPPGTGPLALTAEARPQEEETVIEEHEQDPQPEQLPQQQDAPAEPVVEPEKAGLFRPVPRSMEHTGQMAVIKPERFEEPEQDAAPGQDGPAVPPDPAEFLVPYGMDLGLEDDPETSPVGSIYLHLLSEHGYYPALRLSEADAHRLHDAMHFSDDTIKHDPDDIRFRPKRALEVSMRGVDTLHPGAAIPVTV